MLCLVLFALIFVTFLLCCSWGFFASLFPHSPADLQAGSATAAVLHKIIDLSIYALKNTSSKFAFLFLTMLSLAIFGGEKNDEKTKNSDFQTKVVG